MTTVILSSLAWALALIASAIVLKGHPAEEWVQAVGELGDSKTTTERRG